MGKKGKGTGSFVSSPCAAGGGLRPCFMILMREETAVCLGSGSRRFLSAPQHKNRVSAATRRTPCAVAAVAALTTSRRAPARRAATRLPASALVSMGTERGALGGGGAGDFAIRASSRLFISC
jgi:hypothetical protein